MKKNLLDIQRLVERAEDLREKLQNHTPKFVLCHSDIHAGNLLMDGGNMIYLVDWDEPIMAPKERDLMFIGGGVGNVWNKPLEEKLFYTGYGKTEIDSTVLAYYRHERIVEDIAVYSKEILLSTVGGNDRSEMYSHFLAMFLASRCGGHGIQNDRELNRLELQEKWCRYTISLTPVYLILMTNYNCYYDVKVKTY